MSIRPVAFALCLIAALAPTAGNCESEAIRNWLEALIESAGWPGTDCPVVPARPDVVVVCASTPGTPKELAKGFDKAFVATRRSAHGGLLAGTAWKETETSLRRSYRFIGGLLEVAFDTKGGAALILFSPWRGPLYQRLHEADDEAILPLDETPSGRERQKVAPDYPDRARRDRVQAYVLLEGIVGPDGRFEELLVLECNRPGYGFEDAALEAANQWTYDPPFRKQKPARWHMTIAISFELK